MPKKLQRGTRGTSAIHTVPRAARGGRPSARSSARVKEDLAVELYTHIRLMLGEFGLTVAQQRRAMERARRQRRPPPASGLLVRDTRGVGRMLLEWSREEGYLGADGKPRVLAIAGPGATFETLARRSLPHMPLDEVVALACDTSEVVKRPGGKIALLGSILVKVLKSDERHLAHVIQQIDRLLTNNLHNRRLYRSGQAGGWIERATIGVIARGKFKGFQRELRPQIYDLLLGVDSSIQQREPKTARALKGATAVSVSVYVSEEADLERAGFSAEVSGASASD
jgi:hypothetical protein